MLEKYYGDWQGKLEKGLLAKGVLSDPNRVAIYGQRADQTEGMVLVSDGYGFNKMTTAMHFKSGQLASFYLLSYRGAKLVINWSDMNVYFGNVLLINFPVRWS